MKKATVRRKIRGRSSTSVRDRVAALFLPMLFFLTIMLAHYGIKPHIASLAGSAAILSAQMTVPQGGEMLTQEFKKLAELFATHRGHGVSSPPDAQPSAPATSSETEGENDLPPASSQPSSSSSSPSSASSAPASSAPAAPASPASLKPVRTVLLGPVLNSKSYENYGDIWVHNTTASHKADIQNQLSIRPGVKINLKASPQVLIVHTHTTESFASADNGTYNPKGSTRTTDNSKNVVRIGEEVASALREAGIGVYHDTTWNDYPDYNGAYSRSLACIQKDLKKYPTIQVVLDIHRDSIQYNDGSRAKPTAVIDGKKAAQIMIISACDEPGTALPVPDWQYNYRFGLRIQKQLVETYPGLARPLNLCPRRYNMHVTHGSLLVEFGTDVNTLDEAVYAGRLFGQALSKVLLNLQG